MHRRFLKFRRTLAFTLLELSISVAVIGILLGGALVVLTQNTQQTQETANVDRIDSIVDAIERYRLKNGRLPCPASLTTLPSSTEYGREVNAGDCTYTVAPAGTERIETSASSGVWALKGAVPSRLLGLSRDAWSDSFGNRYTYMVMQTMTAPATFEDETDGLTITDNSGGNLVTDGAYAVISHGKDGKGAYRLETGVIKGACSSTSLDAENCDSDTTLRDATPNESNVEANYFDDAIRWRSKQDLTGTAGSGGGPAACTLPWGGSIADGVDVTAYLTASGTCTSETRTCTAGTLSGTYTFQSCTPSYGDPPNRYAFRLDGVAASDSSGYSVAIGDINGDGYGDAVIGSSTMLSSMNGNVYVAFGSAEGINAHPSNLSTLDGTNGFKLTGSGNESAGTSLAIGDINGDGFDDVIIGAALGNSGAGYTYVVFGKASGWAASTALSSLNGTTGFRLDGTNNSGFNVASGDVNDDGFDDIVVGSMGTGMASRYSYIVFGKASGWAASASLSSFANGTAGFSVYSELGLNKHATGDINGDGIDDLIIGTEYDTSAAGAVYVIFGKTSGWASNVVLKTLTTTDGFKLAGASSNERIGRSVASGDVNGDGYDDVIIGAPVAITNTYAGYTYVVFGKASGWAATTSVSTLNGTTGFRLDGAGSSYELSAYDLITDDFNGDGFDDIAIAAPDYIGYGDNNGFIYVVYGKASGWAANALISSFMDGTAGFKLASSTSGEFATQAAIGYVGVSLASGDLTGDNYNDLMIGVTGADYAHNNAGSTYGVYGRPSSDPIPLTSGANDLNTLCCPEPPTEYAFRLDGVAAYDTSGRAVAIGDINGDGYGDAIIGAYTADNGGTDTGSVYVVFGTTTGINAHPENLSTLNGTNGFRMDGTRSYAGSSVASGDINNDGFDDVIIGGYDSGVSNNDGAVYVVFGKASGWASTLALSTLNGTTGFKVLGESPTYQLGWSVASGDINGDGFDDIIAGSPQADTNGVNNGSTYVIFGKASGWAASANVSTVIDGSSGFRLDGPSGSGWLGYGSASGDINGDGFDDVVTTLYDSYTYVVFGKASGWAATTDLSTLNGTTGFRFDAATIGAVSTGNINNDNFDDLIVGAGTSDAVYVVFGKASGWAATNTTAIIDGTAGFGFTGAASTYTGNNVSSGDVNGDGFDDVAVTAPYADNGASNTGSTYIIFGKAGAWSATTALSTLNGTTGFRLDGSTADDYSGSGLAAGDMTGDGYTDILIGAAMASYNSLTQSGSVYGVYGRPGTDQIPLTSGANDLNTLAGIAGGGGGGSSCTGSPGYMQLSSATYSLSSDYGYTGHSEYPGMIDAECGSSASVAATNTGAEEWIMADLGMVRPIVSVHVAPIPSSFGGWGTAYINGATIECSTDGSSWSTIGSVSGTSEGQATAFAVDASCRYVRLINYNNYVAVGEFWVEEKQCISITGEDGLTAAGWKGVYGAGGYDIVSDSSSIPSYASLSYSGGSVNIYEDPSVESIALVKAESSDQIKAAYESTGTLTIDIGINDGNTHDVSVYFADYIGGTYYNYMTLSSISTGQQNGQSVVQIDTPYSKYVHFSVSCDARIELSPSANKVIVPGVFFNDVGGGGGGGGGGGPSSCNFGVTYTSSSVYSTYSGEAGYGMCDGDFYSGNTTIMGTSNSGTEWINANFGSPTYISNLYVTGISPSQGEGWDANYINGYEVWCDGYMQFSLSGIVDDWISSFPLNTTCTDVTIQGNGYIGVGDFYFD